MSASNSTYQNEMEFCWQQVQRSNPQFRLTRPFAPPRQAERLLPLYALFSAIEQVTATVSDEYVLRQTLAWWRMEVLANEPGESDHPILKLLHARGAGKILHHPALMRLLEGAEERLDAAAPSRLGELRVVCSRLYEPRLTLELVACGEAWEVPSEPVAAGLGARGGLLQLLRESIACPERGLWWIPLELMARHQVSRAELLERPHRPAARALFTELFRTARGWGPSQPAEDASGLPAQPATRHLWVMNAMHAVKVRRLARIAPKSTAESTAAELQRCRPGEFLAGWRAARRCQWNNPK